MTPTPYDVTWAPSALRDMRKLPEKLAAAVAEFVYGSLADNPQRLGRALHLDFAGQHSARRGAYRVSYRIDADAHTVRVMAVDHRADVYRPR